MAAPPAAVAERFSALFADPTKWENFDASYDTIANAYGSGGAGATDAPNCRTGLVQLANRTPIVVAFALNADPDVVYVAHSLTIFPADVTEPTVMDGLVMGLVGDHLASAVPVVFPQAFFTVIAQTLAFDVATIQGAAGHGAVPAVFRSGPHGAGTANTNGLRARRAMVMPPELAEIALTTQPNDGRYSLLGFFNTFLQGPSASADPLVVAAIEPVVNWWRLASTDVAAGHTTVSSDLLAVTTPREQTRMAAWASTVKRNQMARIGVGGPGLSNAAFSHGVAQLVDTMSANHLANMEFERDRHNRTFTDSHGEALAQQMHRFCNVTTDVNLPEVHGLLLKTSKERMYGVLGSLFATRAQASSVPLAGQTAPMATTQLVNDVFRCYMPGGDGLTFAKGLSPFAIVCPGHDGVAQVLKNIQQAQIVEAGSAVTLADASALTADDVRFPTLPFVAVEKLAGWSVVIDVFHGVGHAVAVNVRNAVNSIAPQLNRLSAQMGDTPGAGMELICRVMYDMQQDYFAYLAKVATGTAAVVPDFMRVIELVTTYRADSLSPLPAHWYLKLDCPKGRTLGSTATPATAPASMRVSSSSAGTVNSHADRRLTSRYKESGHVSITSMVGGRQLEYPKQAGNPVCMAWALKGSCTANCKRASQHIRYSQETVKALHKFMDECGVANPQQ